MKTKKENRTSNTINKEDSEAGFLIGVIVLTLLTLVLASCSSDDDDKGPDTRQLFVGTYEVVDVSAKSGYVYEYNVTISNGTESDLLISNFADMFNVPVKANVKGNSLTIPKQHFKNSSGNAIEVTGSGTISGNTLIFDYTTTGYLEYTGNCTASKKQE